MTKDEIIVLLKEQLQLANEQLQQANTTVSSLTLQVNELIERIKSLEELLVQKGIAIDKANRQNKADLRYLPNGCIRCAPRWTWMRSRRDVRTRADGPRRHS